MGGETGSTDDTSGDDTTTGDDTSEDDESGAAFVPMHDFGSMGFEPAYRCDDAYANVPPNVQCEDAVPGDEAPVEDRAAVIDAFGTACRLERICGALWGVDCGAATDGPYLYVEPQSLEVVATCGGACMTQPCLDCPPQGWVCPTY